MCPTHAHFGAATFPENYLVLHLGEGDLVRTQGRGRFQYRFIVENREGLADADQPPSAAKQFWRRVSRPLAFSAAKR